MSLWLDHLQAGLDSKVKVNIYIIFRIIFASSLKATI